MIDEKKLIAEIREKIRPESFGEQCNSLDVIYAMLQLIDEQPKVGEWIPSDVGVPKYNEDVEVTADDGERYIAYWSCGAWFDSIDGDHLEVEAWKEPSEPWKGEEE